MYWGDTSSNALVSKLFRQGDAELKMQLEDLLAGKALEVIFDGQIIFEQLEDTLGAVFSLLMASGYLKPVSMQYLMDSGESRYQLKITNNETLFMFRKMVSGWFSANLSSYGNFKKALLQSDLKYMNRFMNDVANVLPFGMPYKSEFLLEKSNLLLCSSAFFCYSGCRYSHVSVNIGNSVRLGSWGTFTRKFRERKLRLARLGRTSPRRAECIRT